MMTTLRYHSITKEGVEKMTGAELLKKLRYESGKKQREVAREIGVCLTAYQRWEWGVNVPTFDNHQKMCAIFGVNKIFDMTKK